MSANLFGGPYRLTKKSTSKSSIFEGVKSICIMDDNSVSERIYKNGILESTNAIKYPDLTQAIEACVRKLEYLMQKELYNPLQPMDLTSLQSLVNNTKSIIPVAISIPPVQLPVVIAPIVVQPPVIVPSIPIIVSLPRKPVR